MTEVEAGQFLDDIVKPLWPEWQCAARMVDVWVRALQPFSWNPAKRAVDNCYTLNSRAKSPNLDKIIQMAKTYQRQEFGTAKALGLVCHFVLRRLDKFDGRDVRRFYGPAGQDADQIRNAAHDLKERHQDFYPADDGGVSQWQVQIPQTDDIPI